jgi:hypothetical protein
MRGSFVCDLAVAGWLGFAALAMAEEPAPPEMLPAPAMVMPGSEPAPPHRSFRPYYRTSRYDVWQHYAVDRQGYFRPRVIYSPYGAYYLYNGAPFPWTETHTIDFMSYAD